MGDVILTRAAADAIMADVATTYSRALARGGRWTALADRMLLNAMRLNGTIVVERQKAEAELRGLMAAVDAQEEAADRLIAQISDEVWNKIGRPAFDPTYDVVFPNGITYYTGGPGVEQPERMEMLAQLLEMEIIPSLPMADAKRMAGRLREMIIACRKVLEPTAAPRVRAQMFERAGMTLALSAQMILGQLKRLYRAEGFSEAEIQIVIPDQPRKKLVVKPAAPALVPAPLAPASVAS